MSTIVGLDIGANGHTGIVIYNEKNDSVIFEKSLNTKKLNAVESAKNIIGVIQEVTFFHNKPLTYVSEAFLASRVMHKNIFESAKIEAMVNFYFEAVSLATYVRQNPQIRIPFLEKAEKYIKLQGDTRNHCVDAMAHVLAYKFNKGDELR